MSTESRKTREGLADKQMNLVALVARATVLKGDVASVDRQIGTMETAPKIAWGLSMSRDLAGAHHKASEHATTPEQKGGELELAIGLYAHYLTRVEESLGIKP